jgi:hypothetical protein
VGVCDDGAGAWGRDDEGAGGAGGDAGSSTLRRRYHPRPHLQRHQQKVRHNKWFIFQGLHHILRGFHQERSAYRRRQRCPPNRNTHGSGMPQDQTRVKQWGGDSERQRETDGDRAIKAARSKTVGSRLRSANRAVCFGAHCSKRRDVSGWNRSTIICSTTALARYALVCGLLWRRSWGGDAGTGRCESCASGWR